MIKLLTVKKQNKHCSQIHLGYSTGLHIRQKIMTLIKFCILKSYKVFFPEIIEWNRNLATGREPFKMLIKALNSPNKVTAQEQSDQKGNCKPWNWSGTTSLHAESAGQHSCGSQPPSRDVNTLRPRRPQANLSHWVRATWTDLEIAILSEISQIDQNKYRMIALICGIQKWYKWTYLQNRNRPTDIENKLMVTKGGKERIN